MNIILIGMDGTGKTSIARALAHRLKMRLYHTNNQVYHRLSSKMPDYYKFEEMLIKRNNELVIDRLEMIDVYVYNEHDVVSRKLPKDETVTLLQASHNLVILLEADLTTMKLRKPNDDWEHIVKVDYKKFLHTRAIPYVTIKNNDCAQGPIRAIIQILHRVRKMKALTETHNEQI